jgi:hypothetical protein
MAVDGLNAETKLRFRDRELFLPPGISTPNSSQAQMKDESGTVNSVNKKRSGQRSPASEDPNAQIATKLRTFYHQVQDEALPQRFLDLLEKLDAVENSVQRAE